MRDEQVGQPQLLLQLLKQRQDLRLDGDVQRGGGFVQHQNGRLQDQRPGDGYALALPA